MKVKSLKGFIIISIIFFAILAFGEATINLMGKYNLNKQLKKETLVSTPEGYKFNYLEDEEIGDNEEGYKYKLYYLKDRGWEYLSSYDKKPIMEAIYEDEGIIVYRVDPETDELILINKDDKVAIDFTKYMTDNINITNNNEVKIDIILNSAKSFLLNYKCTDERYKSDFNMIKEVMRAEG